MNKLVLLVLAVALVGCDSSQKTQEEIQREIKANQRKFSEERQRIELEKANREKKIAEQRSLVSARFVSVDAQYLEVELANQTEKDIDNIVGSLEIHDLTGRYVTGIALTNWVPGDVYLPVGGSMPARKSLKLERPDNKEALLREAESYTYHYTVLRIQYVGEGELNFTEQTASASPQPAMVMPQEPPKKVAVNQASPESCGINQITVETAEQHYPGSKCEHVEKNIDSERFKQEFIQLCRSQTGAAVAPPSVARVQLSTCMPAPSGTGIVYNKRICCDRP